MRELCLNFTQILKRSTKIFYEIFFFFLVMFRDITHTSLKGTFVVSNIIFNKFRLGDLCISISFAFGFFFILHFSPVLQLDIPCKPSDF